jgi:hypothetical protein
VGWNFQEPWREEFPRDFAAKAGERAKAVLAEDPLASMELRYTFFLHRPEPIEGPVPPVVLAEARHPINFAPYRYEGYSAPQRAQLADGAFRMLFARWPGRVVPQSTGEEQTRRMEARAGELRLALVLPFPLPVGRVDPLVIIGEAGRADGVGIRYLSETTLRLEHDHWGVGLWTSEPIEVRRQPGVAEEVRLRLPPLMPGAGLAVGEVEWEGQRVKLAGTWLPEATALTLGRNEIGASTFQREFSGVVRDADWVKAGEGAEETIDEVTWADWPGLVEAEIEVPRFLAGTEWPVLATRRGWHRMTLWAERQGAAGWRLRLEHGGEVVAVSERIDLAAGRHRVRVALPTLVPPRALARGKERMMTEYFQAAVVDWDGRRVMAAEMEGIAPLNAVEIGVRSGRDFAWGWGRNDPEEAAATVKAPVEVVEARQVAWTERPTWGWLAAEGPAAEDRLAAGTLEPRPWALRLSLRLPVEREAGRREPLLTTGYFGRGDMLFVEYGADGRARLGHDHWGSTHFSPGFQVAANGSATVEIRLEGAEGGPGRLRVTWDGRVGFDEVRPWNPAPESSWTPGANFIGMSAVPRLSGAVDRIERLPVD